MTKTMQRVTAALFCLSIGGFGLLRHGRTGRDDGGGKHYERWKNDV